MLSTSVTSPRTTRQSPLPESPSTKRDTERAPHGLYRIVWRWHFYAGVVVAPVLIVMAATGAMYIFRDELEPLIYARMMVVAPGGSRISYDAQIAAAAAGMRSGFVIRQVEIPSDSMRATVIAGEYDGQWHRLFVDPYRGTLLGELGPGDFFNVVLRIFLRPPKSRSPANTERLPLDDLVAAAAEKLPGSTLSITIPRDPGGAFVVFGSSPRGPSSDGVAVLDHASGEVLMHRTTSQYPALGWWASWNYPLHVGSILGWLTKILWLLVCCALMLLPVTGIWMWWRRRPAGRTGFPRRVQKRIPKGVLAAIAALSLVLPMLGASVLIILAGEFVFSQAKLRQR